MSHHHKFNTKIGNHALDIDIGTLPHERMDVFNVAIELIEFIIAIKAPRGNSSLMDQIKRSSQSVALNTAEACGKTGNDRKRFFQIARGSCLETAASLRILLALGALHSAEYKIAHILCERCYAMLTKLCR